MNIFEGMFLFNSSGNVLTILPNSLTYYVGRSYQVLITTNYLGTLYSQVTNIIISNCGEVPTVQLG